LVFCFGAGARIDTSCALSDWNVALNRAIYKQNQSDF
jgi:hypothetical protein